MTPTSSMLSAIDYTPESGVLLVTYNSGGKQYSHLVPNEVWEAACAAESFGKFFHVEIKKQYPGTPVPVTEAPDVMEEPWQHRMGLKPNTPIDHLAAINDDELFGGA